MYTLKVSYDCGSSYDLDRHAETVEELKARCDVLDADMLRWYIEDESGETVGPMCARHASIIAMMQKLHRQ